jgi:hypothetical protein
VLAAPHLILLLVPAVLVGWLGATHVAPARLLDRSLVALVVAGAQVQAAALVLAAAGAVSAGPALVLAGVVTVAALLWARRTGWERLRWAVPPLRPGAIVAVGGLAVVLALSIRVGFDPGRSLHFETNHYHLAAVAHFAQGEPLGNLPFQNPSVFTAANPAGTEAVAALISTATGSDRLIYGWTFPASLLLAAVAGGVVARELGGRAGTGGVAVGALFVAPLAVIGVHSLANDLVAAAAVTAALALVLVARRQGARQGWLLGVAGLALGLAMGAKYTAFAAAGLIAVASLLVGHGRAVGWLVPGPVLLAGPWLLRNAAAFGNPLYPLRVAVGGREILPGGSGPHDAVKAPLGAEVLRGRGDTLDVWTDLVRFLCWPFVVATLLGLVVAVPLRPGRRRQALAVVVVGVGLVLAYAATPYTGGGDPPSITLLGSNLRYALPALLVGTVTLCAVLPRRLAPLAAGLLAAWSAWAAVTRPMRADLELTAKDLAVGLAAGVVAGALLTWRERPPIAAPAATRWVGATAVAAVLVALVAGTGGPAVPTPLEASVTRALAQAASPGAAARPPGAGDGDTPDVAVLGEEDLRSIVGRDLERGLVQVTDPAEPAPWTAAELDRAVESTPSPVLVIGPDPGIPEGYAPPPGWCTADASGGTSLLVRESVVDGDAACGGAGSG